MSNTSSDVERIVREVLRRLSAMATNETAVETSSEQELVVEDRVVTLAALNLCYQRAGWK